jgi:hypothetical protein
MGAVGGAGWRCSALAWFMTCVDVRWLPELVARRPEEAGKWWVAYLVRHG